MLAVLVKLEHQQPQNLQRELVLTLSAGSSPKVSELGLSETPIF